jgi:hypothetical protein
MGSRASGAELGVEAGLGRASCRSNGQRFGRQVEVVEDGADNRRVRNVGQDAPPAAALAALQNVELESALKKFGPRQARAPGGGRKLVRRWRSDAGRWGWGWWLGNDARAKLGVRGERPVEVDEVGTGRRNESSQQAQQRHGGQHQVGGAVRRGAFEPVGQAAIVAPGEALQREGAACPVAAKPLQVVPIVGVRVRVGVQGDAFEASAMALAWRWAARRRGGRAGAAGWMLPGGRPRGRRPRGRRPRQACQGA